MTDDTPAGRGTHALTTALADLTADAIEDCAFEQVILYGLYTDGRSGYAGDLRRTVKPDDLRAVLAENARLTKELRVERLRSASAEKIAGITTQQDANLRAARDMLRPPDERAFPAANYLIWSYEHDAWWAPFEHGYTRDLTQAGRYLHPRAYQICRNANAYDWPGGLPKEVMIPWTDDPQAAAAAVRTATDQAIAERNTGDPT